MHHRGVSVEIVDSGHGIRMSIFIENQKDLFSSPVRNDWYCRMNKWWGALKSLPTLTSVNDSLFAAASG